MDVIKHCTIGAERAGKNFQDLDLGAWIVFSAAEDGPSPRTRRAAWSASIREAADRDRRRRRQPPDLRDTDKALVKALVGREIDGVPDVNTQLQLIHDRVMPAFA